MITIIAVGSIKENYFKESINEYLKRINKFHKIKIIEVKDEKNQEIALVKEKDNILKHIKNKDYVIALDINGEQITSLNLANKIDNIFNHNSHIVFIIGGSYGLHDDIKALANYRLSFSKLTFPHQLFRIILLEQIYRSFKILNNETYHK